MKILLVDDDAFLRDMYSTKFKEAGHTVSTAQDGDDALRVLKDEGQFDVVVMDMIMPGTTGTELITKIKQTENASVTKCIILSNQGEQNDIDDAHEAGAIGYIIKAESIPSQVVTKVEELAQ